jgi:hypothetical protein
MSFHIYKMMPLIVAFALIENEPWCDDGQFAIDSLQSHGRRFHGFLDFVNGGRHLLRVRMQGSSAGFT